MTSTSRHHRRAQCCGFTLIELLVVLAIMAMLLTISVPKYFQSLDKAKETVLVENLRLTREAIGRFYSDTGRYPQSLDELVTRKYMRTLPVDPITDSTTTWRIVHPDKSEEGLYDLKSGAPGRSRSGEPYSAL